MKTVKKLLSILMVLTMVLSLGVSAFAATVTLPEDAKDHTMVAYQIFKGEQLVADSGNAQLGITGWGDGVNSEALLTALNAAHPGCGFTPGLSAQKTASALNQYVGNTAQERVALANVIATCVTGSGVPFEDGKADLPNGYWVVIDKTTGLDQEGKDSRSTVILEVVGTPLMLEDKIDKPTVQKKVNGADNDVAELGEVVTFTATTKLPTNYADFQHYILKFVDNMGAGLTPVQDETHKTTLKIGSYTLNITLEWEKGGTYANAGGHTFTYQSQELKTAEFPDLKAGDEVVLTYYAEINENAVVRNLNDVTLYYPNDPNWDDDGGTEPPPPPPTTPTPPDTVVVFTFFVDGFKVQPGDEPAEDGSETYEPLAGAGFTLYKAPAADGEYKEYRAECKAELNEAGTKYEFKFGKLDSGFYRLEETTVPHGYNKADDVFFEVRETKDGEGNVIAVDVYLKNNETGEYAKVDPEHFSFVVDAGTPHEGEGHLEEMVINREGLELPETGGIGTTIFYVVGAVLVAAAVVLLVTKRRVNGAK